MRKHKFSINDEVTHLKFGRGIVTDVSKYINFVKVKFESKDMNLIIPYKELTKIND